MRYSVMGVLALWLTGSACYAEDTLFLHCRGNGSVVRSQMATVTTTGKTSTNATYQTTERQPFTSTADFRMGNGFARLHPPREIIPVLAGNRSDSWFDVQNLNMTDREITGKIHFNMLNNPTITINRMTGEMNISGLGSNFSGDCQAVNPDAGPKF